MKSRNLQTRPGHFSRVFISPDEHRLRAGWRLILQTVMMAVIFIGIVLSPYHLLAPPSGSDFDLTVQLTLVVVITLPVYIARRFLDRRSFGSLGFAINRYAFLDVSAGCGIAFLIMGFIYLVERASGWLTFESFAWEGEPIGMVINSILMFLAISILVSWNEELLFRGYQLQTLASGLNLFWAVIISSAVFGVMHLATPNASWVGAVLIFFIAAFIAYGYVSTRQLWLPIGLHIGWNFFEGVVFGFRVSGQDFYRIIRHQVTGPELWTGGLYGPEAGLIVLPALVAGTVLIYLYSLYVRQPD